MKSSLVLLLVTLAGCCALAGAFVVPRALLAASPSTCVAGRQGATVVRAVWGGPEGEPPKFDPRDPRTVEKDSERWFAMQAEREANGELNLFENPAFYSVLFFAVPILILVWGFGSGVIPGLVPVEPDYSLVEEQSLKSVSYSDLTGAAAGAAQRGGSLF